VKNTWIEGLDFYYNEDGYIVLTEKYHLDRGTCCGNGCTHCPYNFENVPAPRKEKLLAQRIEDGNKKKKEY
jgi:hypothetical protein